MARARDMGPRMWSDYSEVRQMTATERLSPKDPTSPPSHGTLSFTAVERQHAARVVEMLTPVVPALAEALRPRTEVVLHDLTKLPKSIVAIGGAITGRRAGGAITDLGMRVLGSGWKEHMLNYRTETADGMVMRSSTVLFRASSGKPVACLCINSDMGTLLQAQEVLATLTLTSTGEPQVGPGAESFPVSVEDLTEGILSEAIAAVGVPVQLMKKNHKTEVVRELDRRGFFALREATELAAQRLGVSRYSIYNYRKHSDGLGGGDGVEADGAGAALEVARG